MTLVASTRDELTHYRSRVVAEADDGTVAVVMTMGALHAGHAELIRQAGKRAQVVIVTDFLNPLQFAPGEDLDKYPQDVRVGPDPLPRRRCGSVVRANS